MWVEAGVIGGDVNTMKGQCYEYAYLAPLAFQAEVSMPDTKRVVRDQRSGGDQHEAVADPEGVSQTPEQLP